MAVEELAAPPRLPALYGRAAAGLLPGRRRAGDQLPDRTLLLRGVRADPERLAGYARVCGFRLTDTLPGSYPQVLAFPLALAVMTGPEFPFPAAGVVHLANRIELHRPLPVGEPLELAVHAERLRPHDRGRQVDVVAVASVAGAEVWRAVSTYLHQTGTGSGRGGPRADSPEPPAPVAIWRISAGTGRAYAAVSGDRNPIHTSTLAARAFGFRRRIAHGMWTKARCLAQLGPRLPAAYQVAVTFHAPVLLPTAVGFSVRGPAGRPREFAVHDLRSGRRHLSGTLTPGAGG